jgi:hypothetical protein
MSCNNSLRVLNIILSGRRTARGVQVRVLRFNRGRAFYLRKAVRWRDVRSVC